MEERKQDTVEDSSDGTKEKTVKNGQKEKKRKCKYEDQGQCKEGKDCPKFHPGKTCLPYSKLGN